MGVGTGQRGRDPRGRQTCRDPLRSGARPQRGVVSGALPAGASQPPEPCTQAPPPTVRGQPRRTGDSQLLAEPRAPGHQQAGVERARAGPAAGHRGRTWPPALAEDRRRAGGEGWRARAGAGLLGLHVAPRPGLSPGAVGGFPPDAFEGVALGEGAPSTRPQAEFGGSSDPAASLRAHVPSTHIPDQPLSSVQMPSLPEFPPVSL